MTKSERISQMILEDVHDLILDKNVTGAYLDAIDDLLLVAEKFNTNKNIQKIINSLVMNPKSFDMATGKSNFRPYKKGLSKMAKYLSVQRNLTNK